MQPVDSDTRQQPKCHWVCVWGGCPDSVAEHTQTDKDRHRQTQTICPEPSLGVNAAGTSPAAAAHFLAPNCVSVTPALMMPVEEVPPEMIVPAWSTISEPLHFWCVSVSTPNSRSLRWMSCT